MKQVKIWTLGVETKTNADRSIYWGSATLPNYADTDVLIIDLSTLTKGQLEIIVKKRDHLQYTKESILDKCMNGGKIIFITTPNFSIMQPYALYSAFKSTPSVHYNTHTNYDLSPISLDTTKVPEGVGVLYDEQGVTAHPFGTYLTNVKKFKFYLKDFDAKKIKQKHGQISIIRNYDVKDGSGHNLGIGFEIEPGKGQVIFLPPPTLISTSEAINKIIEELRGNGSDGIKKITKPYFSERSGKVPEHLSFDHLKRSIDIIYRKLNADGYFQNAFGYDCIDAGYVSGEIKIGLHEQLILDFGERGEHMIPTTENILSLDRDTLFDLIEFLHNHIAKPKDFSNHNYNNCGLHVITASKKEGQREWRIEINKFLIRLDSPFRITEGGVIETLPTSEGLRNLVDSSTSYGDVDNIDRKVERACRLFLGHNSTIDNKKDAIRELADVLEFLRKEVKNQIFSKEENEIFIIANSFGIRHHNDLQKTEYDKESFYPWIFYAYLNTIDLLARLKRKNSNT